MAGQNGADHRRAHEHVAVVFLTKKDSVQMSSKLHSTLQSSTNNLRIALI